LLTVSILAANPLAGDGLIEGTVVRALDQTPLSGAEVVLRAKVDGQLLPVAEITADAQGKFRFEHLPADGAYVYLPGANRNGIHYPGPSVRLSSLRRQAQLRLAVYDAVTFPNPLVVRRHEIILCPQPGALQVTESMLIDNPSPACYVGQPAREDAEPVTLQLAIPANFEEMWMEVTVTTRDGRTLSARCDRPHGIWGNPLTREERLTKFRNTAGVLLAAPQVEQAQTLIEKLETLPTLRDLIAVLRGDR
jgi:hypothetical protein